MRVRDLGTRQVILKMSSMTSCAFVGVDEDLAVRQMCKDYTVKHGVLS